MAFLTGRSVLVTGGAGTIGRELVSQILEAEPAELRVMDSNESEIFLLEQDVASQAGNLNIRSVNFHVGDVRDASRTRRLADGVDVVFHTAALKHVTVCERSPFDAVLTNIIGMQNVIDAALASDVERVILTSSDKAVNPTNVMGTSKLMGERLMTAANSLNSRGRTVFSSTRFGNVLGSRGSVVPIFHRQIREGGPVTLTDPEMTRFVMTVAESCRLVLSAAELARGGEVFVTKMPVVRIEDLACVMIALLAPRYGYDPRDIAIDVIGSKPGEKLYEELMSDEETRRTVELTDMFSVLPAFRSIYQDIDYTYPDIVSSNVHDPYVSSAGNAMSREQILTWLVRNRVLRSADETPTASARSEQTAKVPRRRLAA